MIPSRQGLLIGLFLAPCLFASSYPFSNPVLGKTPAPFTLEYFSSYDCALCAEFEATVLPSLANNIETGDLRVVFRDLPADRPHVSRLAQQVYCLQNDPEYLEFRSQLKDQLRADSARQGSSLATHQLNSLSAQDHQSCMKEPGFGSVLHHNRVTFDRYGFQGTPAFVLTRAVDDGFDQMAWSGQTDIHSIQRLLSAKSSQ